MSAAFALPQAADPGGRPFRKVAPREPCPVCGKPDWCRRFDDGGVECMRIESPQACRSGGWMHWPGGRPDAPIPFPVPAPRPPLDLELCDRAYRELLARLPIAEAHAADLRAKGFAEVQVAALGHGSLPVGGRARARIAGEVERAVGRPLVGAVPGFVHGPFGPTLAAPNQTCRVIPSRDRRGRIRGLRLRVDGATEGKYRWLSGGDGGAAVDGHTVAWSLPAHGRRTTIAGVVEGEDKAALAADRLGYPFLAVAGVGNTANVVAELRQVEGLTHVVVAYDKETDERVAGIVAGHERRLVERLAEGLPGVTILQAQWHPEDGKGLDDVLAVGLVPITPNHPMAQPGLLGGAGDGAGYDERAAAIAERARNLEQTARRAVEQRAAAEAAAAAARREASLISRITARKTLGGDVGNTVAVRVANYAAWYANRHRLQPGDVVPLVNAKIAQEFYDEEAGAWHEAVSAKTVGNAVERFIAKGVVETAPAEHAYTTPQGIERRMQVPGLVWRGRTELLERFATGSVLGEGEERRRGGKQQKRAGLVCPDCGATHAACVQCGQTFDAVAPADDGRALLVNLDDPQPDAAGDGAPAQPGLLGGAGPDAPSLDTALPGDVLGRESADPRTDGWQPGLLGGVDPPRLRLVAIDEVPF